MGLRSTVAGGRYLQARRRAPHRLCFFSPRLGVWEQFEVPTRLLGGAHPDKAQSCLFAVHALQEAALVICMLFTAAAGSKKDEPISEFQSACLTCRSTSRSPAPPMAAHDAGLVPNADHFLRHSGAAELGWWPMRSAALLPDALDASLALAPLCRWSRPLAVMARNVAAPASLDSGPVSALFVSCFSLCCKCMVSCSCNAVM